MILSKRGWRTTARQEFKPTMTEVSRRFFVPAFDHGMIDY
jgi:hypothetical protein